MGFIMLFMGPMMGYGLSIGIIMEFTVAESIMLLMGTITAPGLAICPICPIGAIIMLGFIMPPIGAIMA